MSINNQITLFHFSDLHFGTGNRFQRDGSNTANNMATLLKDCMDAYIFDQEPIIVAVTGDLIVAKDKEKKDNERRKHKNNFNSAFTFLQNICPKTVDGNIDPSKIFIVPGNHDVSRENSCDRFDDYNKFYEQIHNKYPSLVELRKYENPKIIIAEINSCSFVEEDPEGLRGRVEDEALSKLERELGILKSSSEFDFDDYVKIALLHHQIVLLPSFIKKRRGTTTHDEIVNDTIVNDADLIKILNNNNFHLILHGHKHHPCQYVYDPNSYWGKNSMKTPMLIIAGGSCGSKELPEYDERPCNTFNILQMHWKVKEQITIKLTIKGLLVHDNDGVKLLYNKWNWKTINYREFRIQYQQTNKCEWKVTMSNEALDSSDSLMYCLQNCLLKDSEFLSTVYPDQNYDSTQLTIYDISTLKYKYIEAVLDVIKKDVKSFDLSSICQIKEYYDISEKSEQEINDNIEFAKKDINNFLERYQNGS
ncbi:MAG: metallophosphoesterase [Bacteroidetes bacterium]|nr:metallophosphoesterase [Bacteroidota bacterium]